MGGKTVVNIPSKQQRGACCWSDSRETAVFGHLGHTEPHTQNIVPGSLDGGPSQGCVSTVLGSNPNTLLTKEKTARGIQ